jgi:transposase
MHTQIRKLDFTGQNIYAGIDVHKKSWKVSIYSDDLYHKTFNQPPEPEVLYRFLSKHFPKGTYHSVYEAGFCGFWIHDHLRSLGVNNIVVNPADVPTTDKEKKRKTDRVDSNKLAKQLRNGDLEALYVPTRSVLENRRLIRMRRTMVKELTRYKNRVKSDLNFFGIQIPEQFATRSSHWSKRFMTWLEGLEHQQWTGIDSFAILLSQVKMQREHLLEVNRKIRALSREAHYQRRVELLRTVSGIGLTTSMVILTEIDDIHRFPNQERLRSYVGLTPTSHSSGDKDFHGEMINRGNKYLKSAIIESAWIAVRVDPVLHMEYLHLCKRMKKNKAIVRIACKLLNRIHFVLKNEVPYENGTE